MASEHVAKIEWRRGNREHSYPQYSRTHRVEYGGGVAHEMSAAAAYLGDAALPNPEELLVAALASCHMLTFLALCARKGIVVDAYDDDARGTLERRPGEKTRVTRVVLRPRITFGGATPDHAMLASLHRQAHDGCFIASSVTTEVVVESR
ncbi:Putative redox protein [Sandaracinus amylolyticus]|uniref:Putative redox protein n=1 Tax=Sandaracinus amylolyticus TaxID=927083 RepID=A0A0F6W166_9BACT|nr:Putative redox protein [Sandaracinus amylolyticus]